MNKESVDQMCALLLTEAARQNLTSKELGLAMHLFEKRGCTIARSIERARELEGSLPERPEGLPAREYWR